MSGIRRIKGLFHHTHRHRNAVEHILHPEHAGNLPRIRRTAPKFGPQLSVFPPMAVLRPAATLSKPFLIATWVKQEDSAELAEQASLGGSVSLNPAAISPADGSVSS